MSPSSPSLGLSVLGGDRCTRVGLEGKSAAGAESQTGGGVWKIPSVAVPLLSLWDLASPKTEPAKARHCLLLVDRRQFWLVKAGTPASPSNPAMPFHVSRRHPPALCVFSF